jgi:hypothetical protein
MTLNQRILRHPARSELFAYAAAMLDGAPHDAAVASHLRQCGSCMAEMRAIRESLTVCADAPALAPSREMTARILAEARRERRRQQPRFNAAGLWLACRAAGCAAGLMLTAAFIFSVFLRGPAPAAKPDIADVPAESAGTAAELSPEKIREATAAIRSLSAAVQPDRAQARTPEELEQFRAVSALDRDLNAALQALEKNPGCARATNMVHANLERQARVLRGLYVERQL